MRLSGFPLFQTFCLLLAGAGGFLYSLPARGQSQADGQSTRIPVFQRSARGWLQPRLTRILDSASGTVWVNGEFNPYVVYRKLDRAYSGTYGGAENLSFAPYPNLLSPTVNTLQPTLLLRVGGTGPSGLSWGADYAFFYRYDSDKQHKLSFLGQNTLVARVEQTSDWGTVRLYAGAGVMPVYFSRLILSNRYIREGLFDRVPWEYHPTSAHRYAAAFQRSRFDPDLYQNAATQGGFLQWEKGNWQASVLVGRTQLQLFPVGLEQSLPAITYASRLGRKALRVGKGKLDLGLQVYHQRQAFDFREGAVDFRNLASLEGSLQTPALLLRAEAGLALLDNPVSGATQSPGLVSRLDYKKGKWPFQVQVFGLGRNFVCLESEVYNANPVFRQGGLPADSTYNNFLYPAYLNPAGSLVNNRLGVDLGLEKKGKVLAVSVSQQLSREWTATAGDVSFPHMLSGFSRSRFAPWQQYAGPYGRIGNRFRMSLERVRLSDNAAVLKWFSSGNLDARLRIPIGRQWAYLHSFTGWGEIGTGPFSTWRKLEEGYLRSVYQELEVQVPLAKGVFWVALAGREWNRASGKTERSAETNQPLNQLGESYGLGLDLEWAENAGLYLRHRWMNHRDRSFLLDRFSGTETVAEIRIAF